MNRYGYRKIGIIGSVIATTSCFLTSLSPSLFVSFITHGVIGGLGYGMIYVPSVIVVGFYFEKWRPLATGISVCGAGIGGIVLPLILSFILKVSGWQNTFRIMGMMTICCVFCTGLYRSLEPVRVLLVNDGEIREKEKKEVPEEPCENRDFNDSFVERGVEIEDDLTFSKSTPSEINNTCSTILIFQQNRLPRNVSSETILSTQTTQKDSLRSVKTVKTDISHFSNYGKTDSKLSTVYEEHHHHQNVEKYNNNKFCKTCCCCYLKYIITYLIP